MRLFWVGLIAALVSLASPSDPAMAQNNVVRCLALANGGCAPMPTAGIIWTYPTVGTSSGNVLAANTATDYILLTNPSAAGGNTIYCKFGATATVNTGLDLAPGQYLTFENNSFSPLALNCISTGASTPLTIGTN